MSPAPVLILDSDQRSALAAIRSLGSHGVHVTAADRKAGTLGGASRYASARVVYPDPARAPHAFQDWLIAYLGQNPATIPLPMTDLTVPLVLAVRASLPRSIPFPSLESYSALSDKLVTARAAERFGIAVPKTLATSRAQLDTTDLHSLTYPVVVKPQVSVLRVGATVVKEGVHYLQTAAQLEHYLRNHPFPDDAPFLVQEIVTGRGYGVFALFEYGEPRAFFSHQRLRERPPSGGVSVLSESVPLNLDLCGRVARLFSSYVWHGVAMAEFKLSSDGVPYMIEVNGRFWGSLQLAIDCGVDFPALLYQLASGEPLHAPASYPVGRRLRWWLGDLDHLLLSLRSGAGAREGCRAVGRFLAPQGRGTRLELLRMNDPKPAGRALLNYFGLGARSVRP